MAAHVSTPSVLQPRLVYLSLRGHDDREEPHARRDDLAQALRRRGWWVDVFEPTESTSRSGTLSRMRDWLRVQRQARDALCDADVVYVRSHVAALPTAVASLRRGIPVVQEVDTWDGIFADVPWLGHVAGAAAAVLRMQWRRSSALVGATDGLADWAVGETGRDVPARTIAHAVDPTVFRPDGNLAPGLPRRYVVFAGALTHEQGLKTVIDAVREPQWPRGIGVVILGDGPLRASVVQAANDGLPITYLGRLPRANVPSVMRGALAVLNPHERSVEHTGHSSSSMYESLACDTPVIVSDEPGQADLVRDIRCGVVVEAGKSDALAAAVSRLAFNPAAAERMGRRGGGAVRRWHSWDARAIEADDLLRKLAVRRSGTRLFHCQNRRTSR